MRDNLGYTKITRGGLLRLCRLNLTVLNIGKAISNIDDNSYGDEGALVVARHLTSLQRLWARENELGWEGVAAVASSLTKLETLSIPNNSEVSQGVTPLGRLPLLQNLHADNTETKDWTAVALAKQLRRLTLLAISKEP